MAAPPPPSSASPDNGEDAAEAAYAKFEGVDASGAPVLKYVRTLFAFLGREKKAPEDNYIALGSCTVVSRKHAKLMWDRQNDVWVLEVLGKNGMTVNGSHLTLGETVQLSGEADALRLGATKVYFSRALKKV